MNDVDEKTGELAVFVPQGPEFHGYAGASALIVTEAEAAALAVILPDEEHSILPTGEVYVAQVHYRRLLNKTFRIGQWALMPRGEFVRQGMTLCREYALVIRGCFVSEAVGEADYHENNDRMSWASAAEALRSNALTRCCKDIGIASECWDRQWTEAWKAKSAVQVWRSGAKKPEWRRLDAGPFYNEVSIITKPLTLTDSKPEFIGPPAPSKSTASAGMSESAIADHLAAIEAASDVQGLQRSFAAAFRAAGRDAAAVARLTAKKDVRKAALAELAKADELAKGGQGQRSNVA